MSNVLQANCQALLKYPLGTPCMWMDGESEVLGHVVGFKYNSFGEVNVILKGVEQYYPAKAGTDSKLQFGGTYVVHPNSSMVKLRPLKA